MTTHNFFSLALKRESNDLTGEESVKVILKPAQDVVQESSDCFNCALSRQLSATAEAVTEALTVGFNEAAATVQDEKFLEGLGIGVLIGLVGSRLYYKYWRKDVAIDCLGVQASKAIKPLSHSDTGCPVQTN